MNKKLVALAVSAIAAGAASAQTANVTLYGIVDTYLASERTSGVGAVAAKTTTLVTGGGLSGSRFGLRGSESLGGGMNAFFTLESGFNSDNGSLGQGGLMFGRRAIVGVNGGFGSIQMGRDYSPNFYVMCNSDDTFGGCLTGFSAVANMGGFFANTLRQNNQVRYSTPNMGGLTADLAVSLGEVAGSSSGARTIGANIQYKNGPIYAGLGFSDSKNGVGPFSGDFAGLPATTAPGSVSSKQFIFGATYNFGVAYAGVTYIENKKWDGTKTKPLIGSVTVPFGAARIGLQLAQSKSGSNKAQSFALLGEYDLSKRTEVYGGYSQCKNKGITCAADGNTAASTATINGQTGSAIAIGLKHKF
ncbi:MAG: porin [Casimicrobium sp.]